MSSNHSRSTDFKLAIPETDLSRIVQWEDVNNGEQYEVYFTQRLGPDFDEVPVILDLIESIKRQAGQKTILLVEHKMDVVRSLADRIIVLHNGQLVADGKPAEVIASPIVQEAYLGIAPARPAA